MSKTANQITLIIGSGVTIVFDDGSTLTADAFRTTESGIYVMELSNVEGVRTKIFHQDDLLFFPWAKISYLKYNASKAEDPQTPPDRPQGPQG